jgi:hypothetical protein
MDTRTGEIVDMEFVNKLKMSNSPLAKFYKELPDWAVSELQGYNRAQRREWYKRNKKRLKEATND